MKKSIYFSVIFLLAFIVPAFSATINVPADQATIGAAITAASAGDTIVVAAGTYNEQGLTVTKNLTIEGAGSSTTIINSDGSDRIFGVSANLTLSGFTLQNGSKDYAGGIAIYNGSNSSITDCIIKDCTASSGNSGGILITQAATATITNSTIQDNTSTNEGGGITLDGATCTLDNCTVQNNTATNGEGGGGISVDTGSTITITDCTISGNTAGTGAGIEIMYADVTATITNSTISNNTCSGGADAGGGIRVALSTITLTNCLLTNNTAANGAALFVSSNYTTITNCTISDNNDSGLGSILVENASNIKNCIIANATTYGIVDVSSSPISTMVNNDFYGNSTAPYATTPTGVSFTAYTLAQINDLSGSSGNISSDPLFVSSTDYSLQDISPCVDTGTSTGAPSEDINGTERPQIMGTDIGAYEYVPGYIWYLAEGCTNGFDEWIIVQNLGSSSASLTFTFYYSDNTTSGSLTYTTSVAADRRLSLNLNNLATQTAYTDLANKDITTTVESTNSVKIAVDRAMYWDAGAVGWAGSHCSIGTPLLSTTWFFPEGSTQTAKNFQQWFLLFNPNSTAATVTLTFMKTDGTTSTLSATVGATERTTLKVNSTIPDEDFATQITSDVSIAAERAMYWDAGGITQYAGHCSIGATTTSGTWYFAEGTSRTGFDEFILLQNPNSTDSEVTLTFMKTDGTTETATKTIPATGRATVHVGNDVPALAGFDHSVKIATTNDVEFVAERAMYRDYGSIDWAAGHCSIGSTAPATTWYLPEGSTAGNFNEFLLLQNPGSTTATVTLTYLSESTTPVTATTTVGATSRKTVDPGATISNGHFSTKVESTEAIVAERSMYWNSRNAHCSKGISE